MMMVKKLLEWAGWEEDIPPENDRHISEAADRLEQAQYIAELSIFRAERESLEIRRKMTSWEDLLGREIK